MSTHASQYSPLDHIHIGLLNSGASLHWLVPFEKRPIASDWAALPNQTESSLSATYRQNANIGIRLGEPSKVLEFYLHIIDIDIRKADLAAEAWGALLKLLPIAKTLPSVISGSGGESRHLYLLTAKPFRKKKLAKSEGFSMVFDQKLNREVKKYDWEIDLMGTGSQAVIPPSIHPDTKQPYRWERPLDLSLMGIGCGPIVSSATVAGWGADESIHADSDEDDDDAELMAIIVGAPMQLDDDQINRTIADLPADWAEDRDHWLTVGAALHHQFEGKREGFDRWCEWARQSAKFDAKDSARVWKSFKGSTKTPVRMATLIQAASLNRMITEMDFEDDDDHFESPAPVAVAVSTLPSTTSLADLFIDFTSTQLPAAPPSPTSLADLFIDFTSTQLPAVVTPTSLDDLFDLTPQPKPAVAVNNVEIDPDWQQLLHRNEEGDLKSTLHNVTLILRNDRRTAGIMAFNSFSQMLVLKHPPGRVKKKRDKGKPVLNLDDPVWQVVDPANGDIWTKVHDASIRRTFEAPTTQGGYGIKFTDRDLDAATNICASENRFHPVRERLESLAERWDGVKRVETFFIDYLGCDDTKYHRQAAMTMLLGAVARAYEPGHKFDFVAILEGAQGAGKSTFITTLALDWFSELSHDISDNNKMVESMQGSWIIEIGELSAMSRSDVNDLKAFVSRTHDKARLAFEPRVIIYPRQCIFVGSTNDREYLRDTTGNRRYWPIVCNLDGKMIDLNRLIREVELIWGEAVLMYREMRQKRPIGDLPLYLSDKEAAAEAKLIQESKRVESAEEQLAAKIMAWLDSPVVEGDGFTDPDAERPVHQVTCVNQIWEECFGRNGPIPHTESMKIGKAMQLSGWERSDNKVILPEFKNKYGKARVYYRDRQTYEDGQVI